MANNVAEIDLRQNSKTEIFIDIGSSGNVTWSNIPTLDTGYTLTLDAGLATEQSYTVGSGLTIDIPTDSIIWEFGIELDQSKDYVGDLISDSKVLGVYFKTDIIAILR